jgi:dTDP-4-dehydrorhamnose reductase
MRVLITGAGGQLGRDLQAQLHAEELHVRDHKALDITDRTAVFDELQRLRPDWVINAAAFNDVDGAETVEQVAFAVNADGPGNLADAGLRTGARLVHVSTDYVFDGLKGTPYTEEDRPSPVSVYGRSKLAGEKRVIASGVEALVIRTAWLYGLHGKNFVYAMLAAAREPRPVRVVADQVGSPTSTLDLAQAIVQLIATPLRGLIHVVNGGSCSRYDFARAILDDRVPVIPIGTAESGRRAPRPAFSALRSVRWGETGLPPLRPWREALVEFLQAAARADA